MLPNLAGLAVNACTDIGSSLIWSVSSKRILLSYFETVQAAMEASPDGGEKEDTDFDRMDSGDETGDAYAVDGSTALSRPVGVKRRVVGDDQAVRRIHRDEFDASRAAIIAGRLNDELQTHLQWLRLCQVPSKVAPKEASSKVVLVDDIGANKQLATVLQDANAILKTKLAVMQSVDDLTYLRERVRSVNDITLKEARGPTFHTLNVGGRLSREKKYMDWLAKHQVTDGFTSQPLANVGAKHVDHTVPKAWLRVIENFAEFESAANDHCNVMYTRNNFNEWKGERALWLPNRVTAQEYSAYQWAPHNFTIENQAACARRICYMFLTYPAIMPHDEGIVSHRSKGSLGAPGYYDQMDNILKLVGREPAKDELVRAYVDFGYFGWANPLVTSLDVRNDITKKVGPFYKLLVRRIAGTDECTERAIFSLKRV